MARKKEQWKSIIGFEGYYEISSYGRVRSLDRLFPRKISGKILKQRGIGRKKRYLGVTLCRRGKRFDKQAHRLVALAFIQRPSELAVEVNHKNGNKKNNNATNLEWVTPEENYKHSFKNGFHQSKKPVIQCNLDGKRIRRFESIAEAARKTKIIYTKISLVLNEHKYRKTAGGFIWKWAS